MANNWTIASVVTDFLDRRKNASVILPDGWTTLFKTDYGRYHIQYEDMFTMSWDDRKQFQRFLNKHIAFSRPTEEEMESYFDKKKEEL